jgi:hypothetical protein
VKRSAAQRTQANGRQRESRCGLLTGYAATFDTDLDRIAFGPHCFTFAWSPNNLPPLCWKHKDVVGLIERIEITDKGLAVTVKTGHPQARNAGAFSVAVTVHSYKIIDADKPSFHARIVSCTIDEISLTDKPANPRALVDQRWPTSAAAEFWRLLGAKVQILQKMVELERSMLRSNG